MTEPTTTGTAGPARTIEQRDGASASSPPPFPLQAVERGQLQDTGYRATLTVKDHRFRIHQQGHELRVATPDGREVPFDQWAKDAKLEPRAGFAIKSAVLDKLEPLARAADADAFARIHARYAEKTVDKAGGAPPMPAAAEVKPVAPEVRRAIDAAREDLLAKRYTMTGPDTLGFASGTTLSFHRGGAWLSGGKLPGPVDLHEMPHDDMAASSVWSLGGMALHYAKQGSPK